MATPLSESPRRPTATPSPRRGPTRSSTPRGGIVSYKDRWRELDENGVQGQRSKSFSPRELGSLDRARTAAVRHRRGRLSSFRARDVVLRAEKSARLTLGELFKEWIANHAGRNTGERH